MGNNLSRRDFLQTSALGASAMALGAAGTARGYSANEKAAKAYNRKLWEAARKATVTSVE